MDYLEESLRDRFVCGLHTEGTRKRLLIESNLTFAKALEIAQSLETAAKDAQQFKEQAGAVHTVTSLKPREIREACYRCGQTNHSVTAGSKRSLATTVARRGILRLCAGVRSNHKEETDEFQDVRRLPSGLTLMTVTLRKTRKSTQ